VADVPRLNDPAVDWFWRIVFGAGQLALYALLVLLATEPAWAVDCPTTQNWPETHSPSGPVEETAGSSCGTKQSTGYAPGSFSSFEAMAAQYGIDLVAFYSPQTITGPTIISSGTVSGGYITACMQWVRSGTPGTNRGTNLRIPVTATACDPPPGDEADCGGEDVSVGEARDEAQSGEDMWTHATIVAPTWNEAAGQVPECLPMSDSDTECVVTGVYKTGPGLNKNGAGSYEWVASIRLGGGTCPDGTGAEAPPVEDNTQGENCEESDAGYEYCHENKQDDNDQTDCGFYEDEQVCLDRVEDDECWIGDDGARYCGDSAPMPPVPDSGTPGDPAEPDDEIRDPDTDNEYDYYDGDTVGGSARPAGDSGANPNRPGSTDPATPTQPVAEQGDGNGDGDGDGEGGTASGGETCDAPPVCDEDPVGCALLQQQWRTRCDTETDGSGVFTEGEIGGELGEGEGGGDVGGLDAEGSIGSVGACPAPLDITVMGQSIDLDIWSAGCDMALLFGPFVLALGYLIAGLMLVKGI